MAGARLLPVQRRKRTCRFGGARAERVPGPARGAADYPFEVLAVRGVSDMTFRNAAWNFAISSAVPTVTRT